MVPLRPYCAYSQRAHSRSGRPALPRGRAYGNGARSRRGQVGAGGAPQGRGGRSGLGCKVCACGCSGRGRETRCGSVTGEGGPRCRRHSSDLPALVSSSLGRKAVSFTWEWKVLWKSPAPPRPGRSQDGAPGRQAPGPEEEPPAGAQPAVPAVSVGMPLPEPSEQEGESVKAGQEPHPEQATDIVPAAPRKPRKFSKLVLLTASPQDEGGVGSKCKGVPCVMSLEMSSPTALASPLQILAAEEQEGTVQRGPGAPEQKCSELDTATPKPLEFLRTPFGGRLLAHESFLYKQEKAVGDKVYWKCRQHAELGCRGRAITRGPRATVMRSHCHQPDEEGLAARHQCEKLPIPSLPDDMGAPRVPEGPGGRLGEPLEGSGLWLCPEEPEPTPELVLNTPAPGPGPEGDQGPQSLSLLSLPPKKRPALGLGQARPLEFLKTCYGGNFLVHESFLYKREKAVGDKVYWTCRDHVLHGCRSRAITQGQQVTVMRGHSHLPDVEGLEARRRQEKAMETLRGTPGGRGAGAGQLHGVESLLYRRGLGTLTLTRPRPPKRAKVTDQPPALQGPTDQDQDQDMDPGGPEFLRTPLGGSFLVYDSFLYRREKAAGEKVYWTCRDQARMGCRSRAITQGRRVMVMRGHCHPPDLGGLETLRQRENRPSPAHRGSPGEHSLHVGAQEQTHLRCLSRRASVRGPRPRRPRVPEDAPGGQLPGVRLLPVPSGEGGRGEGVLDVPGPGPHGLPQPRHHPGPAGDGDAWPLPPARPGGPGDPAAAGAAPQPGSVGGPRTPPAPGVPEDVPRGQVPGARVLPLQEGEGGRGEGVLDVPGPGPPGLPQPRHHPGPEGDGDARPLPPARSAGPGGPAAAGAAPQPSAAGGARCRPRGSRGYQELQAAAACARVPKTPGREWRRDCSGHAPGKLISHFPSRRLFPPATHTPDSNTLKKKRTNRTCL